MIPFTCPCCEVSHPPHRDGCDFHNDCPTDAEVFDEVSALRSEVARLREERRWIPVTERLPDEGRLVLWYRPDERWPVTSGRFERPNHVDWGGDLCVPFSEGWYTHWMPLPAQPTDAK